MSTNSVVIFPCFTHEQVKEINKEIKKNIIEKEPQDEASASASKIGEFSKIQCLPELMKLIHPWLYECQLINKMIFGYNIYWDFNLQKLNYNVYGKNGEYGWHIDASDADIVSDFKLTCLLNLSEEIYEGGEFYTVGDNKTKEFTSGKGIVFNSLIAHKVTPVTKGERITLTYWGNGPSWR